MAYQECTCTTMRSTTVIGCFFNIPLHEPGLLPQWFLRCAIDHRRGSPAVKILRSAKMRGRHRRNLQEFVACILLILWTSADSADAISFQDLVDMLEDMKSTCRGAPVVPKSSADRSLKILPQKQRHALAGWLHRKSGGRTCLALGETHIGSLPSVCLHRVAICRCVDTGRIVRGMNKSIGEGAVTSILASTSVKLSQLWQRHRGRKLMKFQNPGFWIETLGLLVHLANSSGFEA